ncbi:hypothetical protein SS50377_24362 [Spironucleus salmonicida]|uniref:Uncharacterized protein n=1 Tax=Spironucleus salmonicida TaxID=348837 RepID=V6LN17_9EUKA|nr:hypothetical protein SS50377_24362 [Spironucleus salmonicida]|eukprot:EST46087.1 Hypothetical protein SS50377_14078 [Spironucleus salmonicida]
MQDSITVQINSNNLLVEVENLTQYDPNLINISSFLATDFYFYQSVCKIKQIDESQQLYQVNTEINNLIGPIKQDFVHQKVILDDMSGFYDKFKGYQVFYSYFYQNIHRLENKLTPQLFPPNKEFNRQNPQQLEFKQVEIYESTVQRNLDDLEGYYLQMQPQRGGSMVVQQLDETNSASLLLEELEQIFPKRNQSPIKQNTVNNNLNQTYSNQQLIFLEQKLGYKIPRNLQGVNEVQNYILNITSANDLINILSTRLTSKNSDNSNKQVISQSQIYEISQNKFLDQNLCQTINNLQNIRSLSQLKNQDIIQTQQQQKQYDVRRKAERIKWM